MQQEYPQNSTPSDDSLIRTENIPHKKRNKKGGTWKIIILSSIFGGAFGFITATLSGVSSPKSIDTSDTVAQSTKEIVQEDSAVINVVENSSPSVVSIIVTREFSQRRDFFFRDPFDFFNDPFEEFDQPQGETETRKVGGGSGFLVSSDGLIVTNRHVVSDTRADYTVLTNDGTEYPASVLARDPVLDIAIVKIEGENFPTLPLGDSDQLQIGQTTIAIGNSLAEFANSVSRGIISGLGRDVVAGTRFGASERLSNIIQTDAAINPGNSGGPLLDINGQVIGVNTAVAQGAENIGFALPINQVKRIVDQVKETGKISIPFIGVRYVIIDKALQKELDLPVDYGAWVVRGDRFTDVAVIPGSPGDLAGISENDIILEMGGNKIDSENTLGEVIINYNVGDTVPIKLWSKGEEKTVDITLKEREQ